MIGTAAPARRWLLIEYAGGWRPRALESGPLAGGVGDALGRAAVAAGGRALLIRRPGRRRLAPGRAWAVVDQDGAQQWGRWSTPADLDAAGDAVTAGPTGPPGDPLLLVCAHGQHDTCCAVRGRPVAAALADRWPEQTWECTHIGGDRFAPNLLVVPDGTVYGRVTPAGAVDLVAGHLAGAVELEHLRGFSSHPPQVQAALATAIRAGLATPTATVAGVRSADDEWHITLDGEVEVRVTRAASPPARLTCAADRDASTYVWEAQVRGTGPDRE